MPVTKIAGFALTGILIGALAGFVWQKNQRETKIPLSAQIRAPDALAAMKPNQVLTARIQNSDDLPDDPSQEMRLQMTLSTSRPLDGDVDLQIRLPSDVQIVSGIDTRERLSLAPGETWTKTFSVRGISNQSHSVIKAELVAHVDGAPIGGEAIFSSHPLQSDLSRKAIPNRKSGGYFQKAGTEPASATNPRLPAGIQF